MKSRLLRTALPVLAALGLATLIGVGSARADIATNAAERIARYKQLQHQRLIGEPFAERRESAERFRAWRKAYARAIKKGLTPAQAMERLRREPEGPMGRQPNASRMAAVARTASTGQVSALSTNVRVNNPAADLTGDALQSEVSLAADGQNVVVAWNDTDGLDRVPNVSAQGFGYSTNGGTTWTDGGTPPSPAPGMIWYSDPVLTVDVKRHAFYFAALFADPNNFASGSNGVAVVRGTFTGGVLNWGTPAVAVSGFANVNLYDKEWVAADSISGNVYVSYVHFFSGGDQVEFVPSFNQGASFSTVRVLSSTVDQGYVQAPRVVVGPTGLAHFIWYAIGNSLDSPYGRDFFRGKTATISGTSVVLSTQVTVDSMFVNFGNGAPGFNRGNAFAFPGAAIDNTTSPTRGRLYASWNEAVDFYWDDIGYRFPTLVESPDYGNNPATARAITIGNRVHAVCPLNDQDWYSFSGKKDSTLVVFVDSVKTTLQPRVEIYSSNGNQGLSYVAGDVQQSILTVFTIPQDGTYYIRVYGAANSSGAYSLFTGYHIPLGGPYADRARDMRDVIVKYTDNPTAAWPNTAVRVNSEPGDFDNWLPEIAVGGNGKPYVAWIDFHDAPPGIFPGSSANIYLARSDDGGATWSGGSPVTDVTTNWWYVFADFAPNQGDYIGLHATPTSVLLGWGDGRDGDPNVYFSHVDLTYVAISASLASAVARPDGVALVWQMADASGVNVSLERRSEAGEWTRLAVLIPDGTGRIAYDDHAVTPGRWGYRLSWSEEGVTRTSSEAWVEVPALSFALRSATPNPSPGELKVAFSLPDATPAALELVDIGGRQLARLDVGALGAGNHVADLAPGRRLPAGVYLVRLTQGTRHAVTRISIVR